MSTNPAHDRTRRPGGTPTGGQFAPEAHAEPEVTLGNPPPGSESAPEIDGRGTTRWRNADGLLHRTDGPAIVTAEGDKGWFVNGKRHRTDGPAREWPDGTREWWVNGRRHRDDGPAIERANGYRAWFLHGWRHRTDGPAVERADGARRWWVDNQELTEEEFHSRFPGVG